MNRLIKLVRSAVILCLLYSPAFAYASISLDDFARHAQYIDIKISPQGNYLATTSRLDDGTVRLTVLDIENNEILSAAEGHGSQSINTFNWANDERLIMTLAREVGSLETPIPTGEILAMNADGSRREVLTGPRSRDGEPVLAAIVGWLPHDPTSVLIYQINYTQPEPFLDLYRMHVDTGRKRREGRVPLRASREGGVSVLVDPNGEPRIAMGVDPQDNAYRTMMKRDGTDWTVVARLHEEEGGFMPIAFTSDNNLLMGLSQSETDTIAVSLFDIESGQEECSLFTLMSI